jgi:hypothetical protein
MKTNLVRSRHRLLIANVLALLIVLAALGASPAYANAPNCDGGCINWDAHYGCLESVWCCVSDCGISCVYY